MKLIKYDYQPFQFFNEVDRWFEGADSPLNRLSRFFGEESIAGTPNPLRVDLLESEKAYEVRFEAPGANREDLNVEVEKSVLTVTWKFDSKGEETQRSQQISRSVALPDSIQADQISARYENGLLMVSIPKAETARPRSIAVN